MNLDFYRDLRNKLRALELPHREYVRVCKEVFAQTALAQPGTVIMVVGPTRVGKSRVRAELQDNLDPKGSRVATDIISQICVEATAADSGFFSMKHFTLRSLEELKHPIFGDMENYVERRGYIPRMRDTETTLRIALERGLRARKTKFFIIEEAHHMVRKKGGKRAGEILDSIKCLANTNELVLVMFGGYELLTVGLASAHINGRLKIIHFPRYLPIEVDLKEFDQSLETISRIMPMSPGASLIDYRNSIYRGSLGCIGLVCEWCESAIALMAARMDEHLSPEHLSATRFNNQLVEIQKDIKVGETALSTIAVKKNPRKAVSAQVESPKSNSKTRPFVRKPNRDPVKA